MLFSLGLSASGCVKQAMLNGQIKATLQASDAIETMGDLEVAREAAYAGLVQFEGMHHLAPDNADGLFLLLRGWAGATFAFTEDTMMRAEDALGTDDPIYLYHRRRALNGYERAIFYGTQLLEQSHPGFAAARRNDETMRAWTSQFTDAEDVPALFWTGYAWLRRTFVARDEPAYVSDLFLGVALMERALALDETYLAGTIHIVLGAYHARTALAEMPESKKHFDRALQLSHGRALMPKLQLAVTYHCMRAEKEPYLALLNEVVSAGDIAPELRLQNAIARREAARFLTPVRMRACGF